MNGSRKIPWLVAAGLTLILILGAATAPAEAAPPAEVWRQSVPEHDGAMMDTDANDNVFVVGYSVIGDRVTTRKYSPDGALLWERPYPMPGERAQASWLSVDPAGNVVVSGYLVVGTFNPAGWVVWKYSSNGTLLWKDTIPVPFGKTVRVETDAAGNAYVVGRMGLTNAFGGLTSDAVTIKYSPSGARLWTRSFDGVDVATTDEANSVALSGDGSRIATVGSSGLRFFAVVYDAQGNELGRNIQGGIDPARDAAFGPQNVLYAATSRWTMATNTELAVVKLTANAGAIWIRSYPVGYQGRRIAVDFQGNVVVTGVESPQETYFLDWVTLKLTPDGTQLWSQPYNEHPSTEEYPYFLALDAAGNIYVTGEGGPRDPSSLLGLQLVTIKYAPTGAVQWIAVSGNGRGISVRVGNTVNAVFVFSLYNMLTLRLANTGTPPPPLAAPSGLAVTSTTQTQVRLAWTNNAAGQTGVKIERCRGAGCTGFAQIAQVGATTTNYVNSGLRRNRTYRFRVRAFNASGNSGYSNIVTAQTKP